MHSPPLWGKFAVLWNIWHFLLGSTRHFISRWINGFSELLPDLYVNTQNKQWKLSNCLTNLYVGKKPTHYFLWTISSLVTQVFLLKSEQRNAHFDFKLKCLMHSINSSHDKWLWDSKQTNKYSFPATINRWHFLILQLSPFICINSGCVKRHESFSSFLKVEISQTKIIVTAK